MPTRSDPDSRSRSTGIVFGWREKVQRHRWIAAILIVAFVSWLGTRNNAIEHVAWMERSGIRGSRAITSRIPLRSIRATHLIDPVFPQGKPHLELLDGLQQFQAPSGAHHFA